jgi:hypothetical protein
MQAARANPETSNDDKIVLVRMRDLYPMKHRATISFVNEIDMMVYEIGAFWRRRDRVDSLEFG